MKNGKKEGNNVMPTGANCVCIRLKIKSNTKPLALVLYRLTWNLVTNEGRFMRLNLQANICRMSSDLSTTEKIFRICCERKVMDSRPSIFPENMKSCKNVIFWKEKMKRTSCHRLPRRITWLFRWKIWQMWRFWRSKLCSSLIFRKRANNPCRDLTLTFLC